MTDAKGRSWLLAGHAKGSHRTHEYVLPDARLRIEVKHGTYSHGDAGPQVAFSDDAKAMPGRKFAVQVGYRPDGIPAKRVEFDPDFLGIVDLMETDQLEYHGRKGRNGANGRDGRDGNRGRRGTQKMGRAGDGGNGGHGSNGQAGGAGGPGPTIRIVAGLVKTVDYKTDLIVIEVREGGLSPEYYVRRFDDPNVLRIYSSGGRGGDGGSGGVGGQGGNGGDGYFSGSGGNGGDGGSGGNGGDGGDGGQLRLILSAAELERKFVWDAPAGAGGSGGKVGTPGGGGTPGSTGDWEADSDREEPPAPGSHGTEGNFGHVGHNGNDGNSIPHNLEVIPDEYKKLLDRLPAKVRDVVWW